MKRICVYCGAKPGSDPAFAAAAQALGALLARRGIGVVYGGGNVGLMGLLADAALAGGGEVIGVIPREMVRKEVAHEGLSEQHVVRTMHERKQRMCDLADAFIALPGGFGTMDEIMEMITWRQLGYHGKHCGLLNVSGYYDRLLGFLDHAAAAGLILPQHRALVLVEPTPAALLERILATRPAPAPRKWLKRP